MAAAAAAEAAAEAAAAAAAAAAAVPFLDRLRVRGGAQGAGRWEYALLRLRDVCRRNPQFPALSRRATGKQPLKSVTSSWKRQSWNDGDSLFPLRGGSCPKGKLYCIQGFCTRRMLKLYLSLLASFLSLSFSFPPLSLSLSPLSVSLCLSHSELNFLI